MMLNRVLARFKKRSTAVCDSCGLEITLFLRLPTIGELLDGSERNTFVFFCTQCQRLFCETCLEETNAILENPSAALRKVKTFLCPMCQVTSVEVSAVGKKSR